MEIKFDLSGLADATRLVADVVVPSRRRLAAARDAADVAQKQSLAAQEVLREAEMRAKLTAEEHAKTAFQIAQSKAAEASANAEKAAQEAYRVALDNRAQEIALTKQIMNDFGNELSAEERRSLVAQLLAPIKLLTQSTLTIKSLNGIDVNSTMPPLEDGSHGGRAPRSPKRPQRPRGR